MGVVEYGGRFYVASLDEGSGFYRGPLAKPGPPPHDTWSTRFVSEFPILGAVSYASRKAALKCASKYP